MTILDLNRRRRDPVVRYIDADGKPQSCELEDLGAVALEHTHLVRAIPNRNGQRNTVGRYWSSTTGRHVEFESHLESRWLVAFDFDLTVAAMSAQPFVLTGVIDGTWVNHYPDFFLRSIDGSGTVVDIRDEHLWDDDFAEQSDATAAACETAGLGYLALTAPDDQWWANVEFLSAYRRTPAVGGEHVEELLANAEGGCEIGRLCASVGHPAITRATVLHLLWTHRLAADLDRRLTDTARVWRTGP